MDSINKQQTEKNHEDLNGAKAVERIGDAAGKNQTCNSAQALTRSSVASGGCDGDAEASPTRQPHLRERGICVAVALKDGDVTVFGAGGLGMVGDFTGSHATSNTHIAAPATADIRIAEKPRRFGLKATCGTPPINHAQVGDSPSSCDARFMWSFLGSRRTTRCTERKVWFACQRA